MPVRSRPFPPGPWIQRASTVSDYFGVHPDVLAKYGALDISVVTDLPLFIDPFLLFNSDKATYQALHEGILEYFRFLRGKADDGLDAGLIRSWYSFREIKQNWLGFTDDGNAGHGLGGAFAKSLHSALGDVLGNLGSETITKSSHLEKVALSRPRHHQRRHHEPDQALPAPLHREVREETPRRVPGENRHRPPGGV